jgi:hypothetical protein
MNVKVKAVLFFLGGRRGTHTPKHFVNLTGGNKNFKMLEFPLKELQTYYGYLSDFVKFYVAYVGNRDVYLYLNW